VLDEKTKTLTKTSPLIRNKQMTTSNSGTSTDRKLMKDLFMVPELLYWIVYLLILSSQTKVVLPYKYIQQNKSKHAAKCIV
jgi:hypothetical protein